MFLFYVLFYIILFNFSLKILLPFELLNLREESINGKTKTIHRRGVVFITTAQFHSTKPELKLCAGSNPACGMSEIRDGEDL